MTTSYSVLGLCRIAVAGNTDALDRVYGPGDWPSQTGTLPQIKIKLAAENRECVSRSGPPAFNTTATIRFIAEVQYGAIEDDAGATEAEAALMRIKSQIDVAVVNSYPLTKTVQQILSIRSQPAFNSDGSMHLGGIQIDMDMLFYEDTTDFAAIPTAPLQTIDIAATDYPPAEITISLPQE